MYIYKNQLWIMDQYKKEWSIRSEIYKIYKVNFQVLQEISLFACILSIAINQLQSIILFLSKWFNKDHINRYMQCCEQRCTCAEKVINAVSFYGYTIDPLNNNW